MARMDEQPEVIRAERMTEIRVQMRAINDGLNRLKNARAELVRLKAIASADPKSTADDVGTYDFYLTEAKNKFQAEINKIA